MNIVINLGHGFARMNTDVVKDNLKTCVIRVNPCPKKIKIDHA